MTFRTTAPTSTRSKRTAGFSLIELLVALAIIGVLLFFVLRNKDSATNTGLSNAQVTQTSAIVNALVKKVVTNGDFTGLTTQKAIDSQQLPSDAIKNGAIVNAFNGAITVAAANWGTGTNNAVAVTFTGIPGSACKPLVTALSGDNSVVGITVGTTVLKNATTTFSESAAITPCNNATNTLLFTAM
jgi:prepilin-type N-terminal cleavage/methylation domain-containing protein